MGILHTINRYRTILSLIAAAVATIIAIVEDHVHLVLSDPETYSDLYEHRCGMLLAAAAAWALFEFLACIGTWLFRPRLTRAYSSH